MNNETVSETELQLLTEVPRQQLKSIYFVVLNDFVRGIWLDKLDEVGHPDNTCEPVQIPTPLTNVSEPGTACKGG